MILYFTKILNKKNGKNKGFDKKHTKLTLNKENVNTKNQYQNIRFAKIPKNYFESNHVLKSIMTKRKNMEFY